MGDVGSTVPRRQLGRHLRELRIAAHMTLKTAAQVLEWSEAKMSRIESGQTSVRVHDARAMCAAYGADHELAEALVGLARETKAKGWWHVYDDVIPDGFDVFIGLEQGADRIDWYETDLVPGLFQTPEYHRIVLAAWDANLPADEVERRITVRMQRQAILTRPMRAVTFRVVLNEGVVRYPIGGAAVMADQVRRIIELSNRPNVRLRVIQPDAGMHQGLMTGQFGILRFPSGRTVGEPATVYADGYLGDLYLDGDDQVARYAKAYDDIWTKALDEQASRSLLKDVAGSYEQH
ncbi:helix-turn-helix domain-containing protein [Streptomyces sp. MS19]|uniref:helix-turn-helix domain-containing protein n=1 Tax=Streptomyces sp. MS19 TaxID=3385972 RepID=UPI0039A30BFB